MVILRLVPVSGNPIEVTGDPSLVGRDPTCEIVVTEGSVSRRHARLERRAGAWWVVDQGSANGTFLNSLKVTETALKNGEELRFGALAFRVEIGEDPDATVASPVLPEETVMAAPVPEPPASPQAPPPPPPPEPRPEPPSAPAPPPIPPPSAGATAPPPVPGRAPARPRPPRPSPVPQMPGGAPPSKKGRGPFFWIAIGCCGCLLLGVLMAGVLGGGLFVMTQGAAEAAHGWLNDLRAGRVDEAAQKMSDQYRSHLTGGQIDDVVSAVAESDDATFFSRNIDNDRAVLAGVLTGGAESHAITIHLVKQGGAWKVDAVRLGDVGSFGR